MYHFLLSCIFPFKSYIYPPLKLLIYLASSPLPPSLTLPTYTFPCHPMWDMFDL